MTQERIIKVHTQQAAEWYINQILTLIHHGGNIKQSPQVYQKDTRFTFQPKESKIYEKIRTH